MQDNRTGRDAFHRVPLSYLQQGRGGTRPYQASCRLVKRPTSATFSQGWGTPGPAPATVTRSHASPAENVMLHNL